MQKQAIDLIRQCRGVNRESTPASVAAHITAHMNAMSATLKGLRSKSARAQTVSDMAYWRRMLPYVEAMA